MESSKHKIGVFSHTLIYSVGNLISRGLSFILLPIYSYYISTQDFGVYSFIVSVATIISTILNLGFPSIFIKHISESSSELEKKRILSNVISFVIIITLPAILITSMFANQILILILGDAKYVSEFILGIFSLLVFNYAYYFSSFYIALEESKKYLKITSISAVVNFFLNLILIVILQSGINGIFIAQILSSFVLIILATDVVKNYFRFIIEYEFIKKIISLSYPLLISGIFAILVEVMDRIIIIKFLDESEAGIYSFGYRVAMIFNLFILSFKSAWIPHYMRLKQSNATELDLHIGRVFTKLVFLSALIILCVEIFIDDLFEWKLFGISIFDSKYSTSQNVVIYVLVGYFFSLLMGFYSLAPYLENKTKHFLYSDLLAFVFNLTLNLILIPRLKIIGAALATLLAFFVAATYLFVYSRNRIKVKYEKGKVLFVIIISTFIYFLSVNAQNLLIDLTMMLFFILSGFYLKIVKKDLRSFRII